jgi:hypothetical protein
MKKIVTLLSAALLISLFSYSQKMPADKIPASVKQAFTKMFPGATGVKYGSENKDYEVEFKNKGVEMSANFDARGKWLETETVIRREDLPKAVADSIERNFPGYSIADVGKVEKPGKEIVYEMDLKKDQAGLEVEISAKGHILKKMPWKEEKD